MERAKLATPSTVGGRPGTSTESQGSRPLKRRSSKEGWAGED